MALAEIKGRLVSLIDEYESGIDDCFMRGYVKGSIETYGVMICFNRDKKDEPFHDYCMRLKDYLNGQLENKHIGLFGCHFHNFINNQNK